MVSINKSAIHLSRRGALAAASVGSLLAMPWVRRSAAADSDTINIMGVETAALDDWTAFEQETGLKVAFTGINSDPGIFQQEIVANAAGDTTDIFLMDGGIQSTLGPKGYFLPLDTATLPGWDQLPEDLRHSPLLMGSDGKLYGIPAVLNADSFAYYPDAISEKEPLSLALLFESEETKGKVGLENTWLTTLPMAATYMKVAKGAVIGDPANMTPAEAASVVDFLLERKRAGQFRLFWATFDESMDAMARRETIVSNVWEPVVKQLNRDGKDVRYAVTKEGYNKWLIGAYVASQVGERGNLEVVQKALAGLLGGAYSARIAELRGYGTARPQLGLEYLKAHKGTPEQIQAVEANIIKIDQKFQAPLFCRTRHRTTCAPSKRNGSGSARVDPGPVRHAESTSRFNRARPSGPYRMTRAIFAVFFTLWALVVLVPMAALVVWPFLGFEDFQFTLPPTLDAISQVMASGRYEVTLRTIRIVLTVTALELVVALPFAIWLARSVRSARRKSLVLAALTIPFFLSLASRTIIWRAVLGNTGLVNLVLLKLGLVQEPVGWLLFSEFAVHLGLLAPAFPTMAVPIYLAISLIDNEAIEAAGDLGAGPWRTFVDVILPLAVPGIIAGIIFTSVPILGDTVVPGLLGGGQVSMLGPSMTSLLGVLNYPVASALGLVVLLILGFLLLLARRFGGGQFSLGQIFEELGR